MFNRSLEGREEMSSHARVCVVGAVVALLLLGGAAQAEMVTKLVPVDIPDNSLYEAPFSPAYDCYDLKITNDADAWDWRVMDAVVSLTSGEFYNVPGAGGGVDAGPVPPLFLTLYPHLEFDTQVLGHPNEGPQFAFKKMNDPVDLDVSTFDTDKTLEMAAGAELTVLRFTVTPDAAGTVSARPQFGAPGGPTQTVTDDDFVTLSFGPTGEVTANAGGGPDGYVEDDWPMTPHGWNNPARTIALDGTGSTGTIDTYDWLIAPPAAAGGDFMSLAVSGPTPEVSILAIADALGIAVDDLPGPYGAGVPDPTIYEYRLMLTVTGGGASDSDETTLFVPEPGTLALLSLGGLVALIRRRRS